MRSKLFTPEVLATMRFLIACWSVIIILWSGVDMRDAMLEHDAARAATLGMVFIVANGWLMLVGADLLLRGKACSVCASARRFEGDNYG